MFSVSCCPVQRHVFFSFYNQSPALLPTTSEVIRISPIFHYICNMSHLSKYMNINDTVNCFQGLILQILQIALKVFTYHGDTHSKKLHHSHGSSSKACLLHSSWQTAKRLI